MCRQQKPSLAFMEMHSLRRHRFVPRSTEGLGDQVEETAAGSSLGPACPPEDRRQRVGVCTTVPTQLAPGPSTDSTSQPRPCCRYVHCQGREHFASLCHEWTQVPGRLVTHTLASRKAGQERGRRCQLLQGTGILYLTRPQKWRTSPNTGKGF